MLVLNSPNVSVTGKFTHIEAVLFSDRKMPNALGELKNSSSKVYLALIWHDQ